MMTENHISAQSFRLKGRIFTFTVMQFTTVATDLFKQQLGDIIQKAPKMFSNAPVVLDFTTLSVDDFELSEMIAILKEHQVIPVAIQTHSTLIESKAKIAGLAILKSSDFQDKSIDIEVKEVEPLKTIVSETKLIKTPIRSGQQMASKDGDLIVTSSVSPGAEVLADGHIHVYGALRGRALAGIGGNKEARIFCQSLDAELISIAGFYRLSDDMEKINQPCQIYLKDDQLVIESIC